MLTGRLPPVRPGPEDLGPTEKIAKPLPPSRKVNASRPSCVSQDLLDELSREREKHREWEIARYRERVRAGRYKPRQKTTDNCSIPFGTWLLGQWRRRDPIGELVRTFCLEPDDSDFEHWQMRLEAVGARKDLFSGLKRAHAEWKEECRLPAAVSRDQKADTQPITFSLTEFSK